MPDFSQLTDRQREIYEYISAYISEHGYGPTIREIGHGCVLKSTNAVACHLKPLKKKGLIQWVENGKRTLALVKSGPSDKEVIDRLVALIKSGLGKWSFSSQEHTHTWHDREDWHSEIVNAFRELGIEPCTKATW